MKRLPKLSYATKILLMTFLIILVMALILSFSSWSISSSLFSQLEMDLLSRSVQSAYAQLSTAINAANNFATQIVHDPGMRTLLSAEDPDSELAAEGAQQLDQTIRQVLNVSASSVTSALQFVNVYLENGWRGGSVDPEALPYQTFSEWVAAIEATGVTGIDNYVPTCWFDDVNFRGDGVFGHCLIGVRFLYDGVTLDKVGVVVTGIKQTGIETIFEALSTDIFLTRRDGTVISAARMRQLGEQIDGVSAAVDAFVADGSSHLVTLEDGKEAFVYRMSGGASWLVCPVDENLLEHSSAANEYYHFVVFLTLLALALALLLSWLSSKKLTSSLVRLKGVVQRIYDGDLSARFQTNQHDEIAYLGLKINDMMEQIDDFFHTQKRDAIEKKDLELQLMQSQINPHLLYNTLNSALWIIRQGNMEKAEDLILSLSSFFKLTLSKGNEEITLANEIAMIQYYLRLQNLGRGKSFTLRDEVPEPWRGCRILRLTLQPLVENSVIHGFSDWRDDGEVVLSVRADEEAGQLQIILCDNGIGILPEELDALLEDLRTYPPKKDHTHYGLYNVERRIQNKYGAEYGLTIESEVGDFTRITVTVPIRKEKQND